MNEELELRALLKQIEYKLKYDRFRSYYFPDQGDDDLSNPQGTWSRHLYAKHLAFFEAGAKYKQRLYSSSNRCGKTTTGAFELCAHMTGIYPEWWNGYRFDRPISAWCVGQTSESTQKILQKELLGEVGDFGSGMIPKDLLDFDTLPSATKMGVTVSGFKVRNKFGGYSTCSFKSQEQGVLSFVGTSIDVALCDEPLKLELYNEIITRLAVNNGLLMLTSTPILGLDPMLLNFCDGEFKFGEINPYKVVLNCTFDDIPHLSAETKEQLLSSYPEYQRECRATGVPMLGKGAVFPFAPDQITCDDFAIPAGWKFVAGCDVGWRCTARVDFAIDPNNGNIYATNYYSVGQATPREHYLNWAGREDIPIAIDPAAHGRSQADGEQIFEQFRDFGLTLENAENSREASYLAINELLRAGKLKLFKGSCRDLVSEILNAARMENGKLQNQSDLHGLDALRYGVMTRDIAKFRGGNQSSKLNPAGNGRRW